MSRLFLLLGLLSLLGCSTKSQDDFAHFCIRLHQWEAKWAKSDELRGKHARATLPALAAEEVLANDSPSERGRSWLRAVQAINPSDTATFIGDAAKESGVSFSCPALQKWDRWVQADAKKARTEGDAATQRILDQFCKLFVAGFAKELVPAERGTAILKKIGETEARTVMIAPFLESRTPAEQLEVLQRQAADSGGHFTCPAFEVWVSKAPGIIDGGMR